MEETLRGVCLFGAYDRTYPRSAVIRRGLEALGVTVLSCRSRRKAKMPERYPVLIARYLRLREAFDVVLVPEFRHKDVPLAAFLSRMTGKLCVFDPLVSRYDTRVHDRGDAGEGSFQSWHNRNLDSWSMSLPDLVLADTSAHADYFRAKFAPPDADVRVLPVGYDDATFVDGGEEPAPDDGTIKVLFYGNYLPLHGVDTIVRAARILAAADDTGVAFQLIGGGQTFAAVESYVSAHRLHNVELKPRVPFEELPALVAGAAVCLGVFGDTPKASRVVPNKVFQCMGVGRPVVTSDSPATRELFADGENVVLVPPADPSALAAALRALARDGERRRRIGRAGAEHVRRNYSARRIAERFVELCVEARAAGEGR